MQSGNIIKFDNSGSEDGCHRPHSLTQQKEVQVPMPSFRKYISAFLRNEAELSGGGRRFLRACLVVSVFPCLLFSDYAAGLRSYESGDFVKAIAEWGPLADSGDAQSQSAIAYLYWTGKGYKQDLSVAALWYRKAADQGVSVAQCNLGRLYLSGSGNLPRDYNEASAWFQKAANQGYKPCQNYLAYRYLNGSGVAQDYVKAEMWFSLSGPGMDQEDADARAETMKNLTPEQASQAMRMAQEWQASFLTSHAAQKSLATLPSIPLSVRWCDGCAGSGRTIYNGLLVESLRSPAIAVSVMMDRRDGHFNAIMNIANLSAHPIDILPPHFTVQTTVPMGKEFTSYAPGQVMEKRGALDIIASAIVGAAQGWSDASLKNTATATVTNPDGTTSRVDVYSTGPTQAEIDQRARTAQSQQSHADSRSAYNADIARIALLPNTLMPANDMSGAVFFPIEFKKYSQIVLRLPLGGTVFEFPFSF